MSNPEDVWENLLDPEKMRDKLISASLYITAFELLKDSVCERVRSFYMTGFDSSGLIVDDRYSLEVLKRNRSKLYASLDWFIEAGAIDASDVSAFNNLKSTRNKLAHELQSFILGKNQVDIVAQFQELFRLYRKIEVWWIVNVEIPTNPDFDEQEISPDEVVPGSLAMLQMMVDVASGNRELLNTYRATK